MAPPSSSQGIEETVKDGDVRGSAFAGCAAPCDVRLGPGPGLRSADGRLRFALVCPQTVCHPAQQVNNRYWIDLLEIEGPHKSFLFLILAP